LLLPILVWKTVVTHSRSQAFLGLGLVIVVVVLGYAPFIDAGPRLWQGTLAFADHWQTNSLLFPLLQWGVGNRWVTNLIVALLLGCLLLLLLVSYGVRDERAFLWINFLVLGLLFLLSPVGNPWYFLWLMPFLCVFPSHAWLLL